jgi:hypothetical protein
VRNEAFERTRPRRAADFGQSASEVRDGYSGRPKGGTSPNPRPSGLRGTWEDADRQFREEVKGLHCPGCGAPFTDAAVDWSDIWFEGYSDLMTEKGWTIRDGPCKLKCERCGHRSWLNYFAWAVTSAEGGRG